MNDGLFVFYGDTDSCVGVSVIRSKEFGNIEIQDLFRKIKNDDYSTYHEKIDGRKFVFPIDKRCMFYNEDTKEATYGLIHYIEKHMVKKRLYRIKIKDKYVDVTEDHSVMVIGNDGILFEKKPKDICKGDKVINIS